jgi:DNA-binding GntR family transcriptional regulator
MVTKKIVTLSMREQIYDALHDLILNNSYGPNSVLQIDRLAEEFGVSATPVREALVRLEADGLVILVPNKGAVVTDITEEGIRNNWEMRRLLEPYAARQSAALIPDDEIEGLQKEIDLLKEAPFDKERYIACDNRLHETLYHHLSNSFLADTIRKVHKMSTRIRYFPEGSNSMHEQVVQEVMKEHLAILEALRARNPERIGELVYSHLLNGEKRAMSALVR